MKAHGPLAQLVTSGDEAGSELLAAVRPVVLVQNLQDREPLFLDLVAHRPAILPERCRPRGDFAAVLPVLLPNDDQLSPVSKPPGYIPNRIPLFLLENGFSRFSWKKAARTEVRWSKRRAVPYECFTMASSANLPMAFGKFAITTIFIVQYYQ
ncbi:MAG: hypothetical protein ACYC9Y_14525 [Candidatus Methylomirabilia bacterium]